MICKVCGKEFEAHGNRKRCSTACDIEAHLTRKYRNNPKHSKVNGNTIIYECRCITCYTKHDHHFDYINFPNTVLRLCTICHAAEHKRLRSLSPSPTSAPVLTRADAKCIESAQTEGAVISYGNGARASEYGESEILVNFQRPCPVPSGRGKGR